MAACARQPGVGMGSPESREGSPRSGAVVLALRYYGRELSRLRLLAVPAMLLPALGNIGINYIAPLVVAAGLERKMCVKLSKLPTTPPPTALRK